MKTDGILYSTDKKKHSSNRFLSKGELKQIFPDECSVTMVISYRRKSMRLANRREGKYVCRSTYPRARTKSRVISI